MENNEENKPKTADDIRQEARQKEQDRYDRIEQVRVATVNWMKTDEKVKSYLNNYNSHYVEYFINGYADTKSQFTEWSGFYEDLGERHETQFLERAEDALVEIQLKKLFDLRCKWGAEQIEIDEIQCSPDFYKWAGNVLNCHFIDDVTEDEVEMYKDYIWSNNFNIIVENNWICIEDYREGDDEDTYNTYFTEWFAFHNSRTGNNVLLLQPDIRGKREEFYKDLDRKKTHKDIVDKYETGELEKPTIDERPKISEYSYVDVLNFMKEFETAETIRKFETYHKHTGAVSLDTDEDEVDDNNYLDERVEEIMLNLTAMPKVKIAVDANNDWRKALIEGWAKFEKEQIASCLKLAYNNYLFRRQSNIQFAQSRADDYFESFGEDVKKMILNGRELNGESRDFNF